MSRIHKVSTRRRVATQATVSAFVVAAATYAGAQVITATPAGNDSLIAVDPTGTPAQTPESPAPKPAPPKPKPARTTVAPKPTEEPKPTYVAKPKPTYTKPKPTYTKEPVAGGLTVELYPYDTAKAGAQMSWKVKAYDPSGRVTSISVHFGDGSSKTVSPGTGCGEGVKQLVPHTYAKAGTYGAKAVVTTADCGAATETRSASSSVKVLAADYVGNGPAAPAVSASGSAASLALHGADADGWVKKFWVDWGDGNEVVVGPRPFDGCQDGKPSSWDTTASHAYAAAGTYTVTVTVMSTNCDADQGQTASYTMTLTV